MGILVDETFFDADVAFVSQSIAAAGTFILPAGWLYVIPGATSAVQVNDNGTFKDLMPDAKGGLVLSDGVNMRVENNDAGAQPTLYKVLRGVG